MDALTDQEVHAGLENLPGWEYDGDAISRTYTFPTFMDAIGFVNRIAEAAEAADHHPELANTYNKVDIRLRTHSADAVTAKDLDLARAIEQAAG